MAERVGGVPENIRRRAQQGSSPTGGERQVRRSLPVGGEDYKPPLWLGCSARLSQGDNSPLDYDGRRARWIEGLPADEYLKLWDNNGTLLHEPLGLIDDKIKE